MPNPGSGMFHIRGLSVDKIEVFNISGKSLKTVFISNIDISSFPSGIYFFKIYSNAQVYTEKVVVSK